MVSTSCIGVLTKISEITEDGLFIKGIKKLKGGTVDSNNDHRIAMSAAVAAFFSDGEITVSSAECTDKSYPSFWEEFEALK